MYTLKEFYNNFGLNWTSTRDCLNAKLKKAHLYELRGDLENILWSPQMKNRNGNYVQAYGSQKIGNYWRLTPRGIMRLYEYFGILDNLNLVSKELLLGKKF